MCRQRLLAMFVRVLAEAQVPLFSNLNKVDLTPPVRPDGNTIWTRAGMSRSKHTEAQIIAALKQVEAGRKAEDVAREQGVSKHTVYAWKAKYGGMDVSQAERGQAPPG